MRINSINNNYTQPSHKGKFIKTEALDKVLEHSSLTELNRFCKYLENVVSTKDTLEFSIHERVGKSKIPRFIRRDLIFRASIPNFSYNRTYITDEWPKDKPSSNFDYRTALYHINKELEYYYPNRVTSTDNFNKEQALLRINYLLDK